MADETPVQQPVTDEIASARRDIDLFSGWLSYLPNPDVIFKEQPSRGIRIYRDMLRDPHIRSVMQTRRLAVVGKEWDVVPASDRPEDERVKEVVELALGACAKFERARYDLLEGIWAGFAVGEVMWGLRDGWVVPTEIRRRGQHRFVFDFDGRLRLLTLANMIEGEALPERKFLVFQYDADPENPYGVGVGQSCYWSWHFKKHGVKFWVVFMDKFAMPTPIGKYPTGLPKDKQDELLAVLKSIQTDSAVKIPENVSIEFKEAARTSTVAVYDPFIDKMNAEISKAVLGQTLTTQEGKSGSLSLGQVHGEVRADLMLADCDLHDEVLNQLIRWIVDFNFGPDVPAPAFHTRTTSEPDLMDQWRQSFRDSNLQRMGLRIPASYARTTYNIPEPEGEDDVLVPPAPAGADPTASAAANGLFAEADRALLAAQQRADTR